MGLIAKVSRGSKMDQIYIPKNRAGFVVGDLVVVNSLKTGEEIEGKNYFYGIDFIEPIKLEIVNKLFGEIDLFLGDYDNIIITGSFLDKGFHFNDVDILVVSGKGFNVDYFCGLLKEKLGIQVHIVKLEINELVEGLRSDPLYQMMLSKCISKKRFVYNVGRKIDYKMLDLHLLKSKVLLDGFDILDGIEKYKLVRNLVAISLFLEGKKVSENNVLKEIKKVFSLKDIQDIKINLVDKGLFLRKFSKEYNKVFEKIMKGIKNGSKYNEGHK